MPAKSRRPKEQTVKGKETWHPDADTPDISILREYVGAVSFHDRAKAVKSCCGLEWDPFLDQYTPAHEMRIKVKRCDLDVADAEFNSDEIGSRRVYAYLNSGPTDLASPRVHCGVSNEIFGDQGADYVGHGGLGQVQSSRDFCAKS